ncbi:Uncharacterized protein PECH_006369 [Penicillium ucsense]|uniref:Small secreted protein n=1 Tax=Penicillium ucsense TaxID=2839758 RepID=A0A8J8WLX7_9EURO|nr:Uncharacterized protein PECM_006945 [Penicillium ucsense]KAF7735671.1 Uncharacterized protein PECH_006369 [Penicillium ucsense]
MQFTQVLLATLLAVPSALAAPSNEKSMMASSPQWTIQNMKRVCAADDSSCTWTFGIYPGSGDATACKLVVTGDHASQANGGPVNCGDYTVTSGWSGQFGAGNGFTTLAVVNNVSRQIAYPAYNDKQVESGNVVKPDQSYPPYALP